MLDASNCCKAGYGSSPFIVQVQCWYFLKLNLWFQIILIDYDVIIFIIAVLKTYELRFDNPNRGNESKLKPVIWTAADILASAIVHKLDDIDVLVIAWSATSSFDNLDELTLDMLSLGVQEVNFVFYIGNVYNVLQTNIIKISFICCHLIFRYLFQAL